MAVLTKGAIFNSKDLPTQEVQIPEWGGSLFVRMLTAEERDAYEGSNFKLVNGKPEANMSNARARFAVLVACDENGKPIFVADDAPELGRRSSRAVDRIVTAGRKLNGIGEDAVEDAKKN